MKKLAVFLCLLTLASMLVFSSSAADYAVISEVQGTFLEGKEGANAIDGDENTSAAIALKDAETDYMILVLDKEYYVTGFEYIDFKGKSRYYYYQIEVSTDNQNWVNVYNADGTKATAPAKENGAFATLKFDQPANAKYIKIKQLKVYNTVSKAYVVPDGGTTAVNISIYEMKVMGTAPQITAAPVTTSVPVTTSAPVTTAAPVTTVVPVTTAVPVTTSVPVTTAAPVTSPKTADYAVPVAVLAMLALGAACVIYSRKTDHA